MVRVGIVSASLRTNGSARALLSCGYWTHEWTTVVFNLCVVLFETDKWHSYFAYLFIVYSYTMQTVFDRCINCFAYIYKSTIFIGLIRVS